MNQCPVCKESFKLKGALKKHVVAFDHRPRYECGECGGVFKSRGALKTHKRSHSLPFECNQCDKAFPIASSLKRHALVHLSALDRAAVKRSADADAAQRWADERPFRVSMAKSAQECEEHGPDNWE
jgi:uncharacterized Zn-finger protein